MLKYRTEFGNSCETPRPELDVGMQSFLKVFFFFFFLLIFKSSLSNAQAEKQKPKQNPTKYSASGNSVWTRILGRFRNQRLRICTVLKCRNRSFKVWFAGVFITDRGHSSLTRLILLNVLLFHQILRITDRKKGKKNICTHFVTDFTLKGHIQIFILIVVI